VDITVYLPDEIGQQAKQEELTLSRLLRDAVTDELERRRAVNETLSEDETKTYELELEDGTTGRLTGREIAYDNTITVYLTDDERVIIYDSYSLRYWDPGDDLEEELSGLLSTEDYVQAMQALGLKPIIDI
jgi:hypothetical protein